MQQHTAAGDSRVCVQLIFIEPLATTCISLHEPATAAEPHSSIMCVYSVPLLLTCCWLASLHWPAPTMQADVVPPFGCTVDSMLTSNCPETCGFGQGKVLLGRPFAYIHRHTSIVRQGLPSLLNTRFSISCIQASQLRRLCAQHLSGKARCVLSLRQSVVVQNCAAVAKV
jgi:hypothetical protein